MASRQIYCPLAYWHLPTCATAHQLANPSAPPGDRVRQEIYTRVARILISVNPFRALPIYSARHRDAGGAGGEEERVDPGGSCLS